MPAPAKSPPPDDDLFGVQEFGVLVEKGKAAYKKGRFMEAIQAWKGAQGVDPSRRGELTGYLDKAVGKQVALHLENAKRSEAAGDQAQAVVQYKHILRLDPRDGRIKELAMDKVHSSETKAQAMSVTVLAAIGSGFLLLSVVALWYIITKLD